jgi:hypothetical protein
MADPDYENMSDEELLKAAQAAGVTPPAQAAAAPTGVHLAPIGEKKPPAQPQEGGGASTLESLGMGVLGGAGAVAAAKFPELRTAISNLAARAKMGAPMRQTAEAILRDVGDTQAASQRLRDLAAKMRQASTPETIGDVMGPQGQQLAKAAIAKPGAESAAYAQSLEQRQKQMPDRLTQLVEQELGNGTPYTQQEQQFLDLQKARAQPLYDAAYQQFPSLKSNVWLELMNDPAGQLASKNATLELQRRNLPVGPVTPGGMVQQPSLAYFDQFKRELDKVIGGYRKAGILGTDPTAKAKAASLGGMRDRFLDELDRNTTLPNGVSPYAVARRQFSSDQKVIDALHSGHDDFEGMSLPEMQEAMKKYLPGSAEREAFTSGVAESLLRKIGKTGSSVDTARKLINSPDTQAKIGLLFDNPQGAENFVRAIEKESGMFNFSKEMLASRKGATVPTPGGPLIPAHTAAGALLGSPWHQKYALLRGAASLLGRKPFPDPGVSTIMGQSGGQGAMTLEQLADAMPRMRAP